MSNLFFREFGSGKPLIILHGLLGCWDYWIFHGKKLSDFFHVYILDLMNHGNSPHSSDINYDLLSDDIYEFINSNKLSSVNMMGHSMGGKVAMSFALKYNHLVENLIILDIAPKDYSAQSRFDEYEIGKAAIKHNIPVITTIAGAFAILRAIRIILKNKFHLNLLYLEFLSDHLLEIQIEIFQQRKKQ